MTGKLPLVEGAAIAIAAVLCLVFQLRLPAREPGDADYEQLKQVLAAEAQPGDAVLLYPWWTERARLFAPPQVEVVGYQGSDGDALQSHPRVWALTQFGLPRASESEFMKAFGPQRTAVGEARDFGHLKLQLFTNGRHRPARFSAQDALREAKVYVEQAGGGRVDCQWSGRGFRCPNGEVAVEWHELKFAPYRCFKFWPPGGASKLVAEFANVPQSDELQLRAGMAWDRGWFHEPRFSPTDFGVEVNGEQKVSLTIPAGVEGQQTASGPGTPQGATVKLWVRAQNPELREACVQLDGLGAAR